MEEMTKERRRISYAGLLDSAIRSGSKLATTNDAGTRALANQLLADLFRLRREMPSRRRFDTDAKNEKAQRSR